MIYGARNEAWDYNEIHARIIGHTESVQQEQIASGSYCQFGTYHLGTNGQMVMGALDITLNTSPVETLHILLDGAGLIPGVGIVPDAIKELIYTSQGDWGNAALSGGMMIPVAGDYVFIAKYGSKSIKLAEKSSKAIKAAEKESSKAGNRIFKRVSMVEESMSYVKYK